MNADLTNTKPVDLNEWAYNIIKQRILDNELLPNAQLNIEELSAELNISRTPIREALIHLSRDGLVEVKSRVGFFVRGITRKELADLFELRRLIEAYAAERAAERLTPEQIAELTYYHEQSCAAVKNKDYLAFNKFETQFHNLLLKCLDNERISATMNSVRDCIYRQRIYALNYKDNIAKSIKEHGAVLRAIAERKPEKAKKVMEKHIDAITSRLMDAVEFED